MRSYGQMCVAKNTKNKPLQDWNTYWKFTHRLLVKIYIDKTVIKKKHTAQIIRIQMINTETNYSREKATIKKLVITIVEVTKIAWWQKEIYHQPP